MLLLSLVVTVAVVLAVLYFVVYPIVKVPEKLKDLPGTSFYATLMNLLLHKPYDKSIMERNREIMEKHHISTVWYQGTWSVAVSSVESAEKIYKFNKIFPKVLLTDCIPRSIFAFFLGTNVVFSNDEVWKQHRQVVNPPFKKGFDPNIFADLTNKLFLLLEKNGLDNIEVHSLIQRLTIDALGKAAMGLNFDSLSNPDVPFINSYNLILKSFSPLTIIFPLLETPWNPFRKPVFDALSEIESHFKKIINTRRQELIEGTKTEDSPDLLTSMLIANQNGFGDKEMRDNIMIFLMAGQDTTALALCAALYLMATHPKCQDQLVSEIKEKVGFNSQNPIVPTHQQLREMPYLSAFIKETTRLYPPVSRLPNRICTEDVELEGRIIPKGTQVLIETFLMQRDPKYWENPDTFDPTRFMRGDPESAAWSPFGGGSRLCLGMNFSLLEQKVVLVMILQKYDIISQSDEFKLGPSSLLAPDDLRINFNPRI